MAGGMAVITSPSFQLALIAPAGHLHRFLDASGQAGCSFPLCCASPRTSPCLGRSHLVCFACCWLCSSRFFSSSLQIFVFFSLSSVLLLLYFVLLTTGSLAVVPSVLLFQSHFGEGYDSVVRFDPWEGSLQQRVLLCVRSGLRGSLYLLLVGVPQMPLCDAMDCVHLHNESLHRGRLSLRGPLVLPTLLGVWILVSLSVVWLKLKNSVYLVIVKRCFPSRVLMTFSLSGHRHLLRNVIRTAVRCDCASYS